MLYPTLNEVTELLNEYKVTPVFCEVLSAHKIPNSYLQCAGKQRRNLFYVKKALILLSNGVVTFFWYSSQSRN